MLFSFLGVKNPSFSQNFSFYKPLDLGGWIDFKFAEGLKAYNIPGACFVLIQGDSVGHINGYGVADIETKTPVNLESSIFRIGSISKTFVAVAAMQLWEEGKLNLDVDINNYLKTFQLDYKFNDSITVRNLLTHSAGFDDHNIGWIVETTEEVVPLAQYLKKRMSPQIRPAGTCITYTNHAYGLLALVVEEVSGLPFYEYVTQNILKPLEMCSSGFKTHDELEKNYVSSYLPKDGELIPFEPIFMLNYPAGSLSSTAPDMGHYISMFLNNGNYKGVQVLDSTTVAIMFQTGFKNYKEAGLGWLLGFSEFYQNGFHIIRHMGMYQGFTSDLILIPELNTGFFLCVNASSMLNSPSHAFIQSFSMELLSRLLPVYKLQNDSPANSPKAGKVAEPLDAFSGYYRKTNYPHKSLDKIALLMGFAQEIEIISNDSVLEIKEWHDILNPISDLTFLSTYNYVAFGKNTNGKISYFFNNTDAYEKLKWYEPAKFQIYWVCSIFLVMLIYILTRVVDRLYLRNKKSHRIYKINFLLATLIIIFLAMLALFGITTEPSELFYGIPFLLKITLVLPFLIISGELISFFLLAKAFRYKELKVIDLIFQSVIVATALAFIPWLMYYNLFGFNY